MPSPTAVWSRLTQANVALFQNGNRWKFPHGTPLSLCHLWTQGPKGCKFYQNSLVSDVSAFEARAILLFLYWNRVSLPQIHLTHFLVFPSPSLSFLFKETASKGTRKASNILHPHSRQQFSVVFEPSKGR